MHILTSTLLQDPISADERLSCVNEIHAYQSERTGMFVDTQLRHRDIDDRTWSYISAEATHLCLAVLSELDEPLRYPLRIMMPVGNQPAAVSNWMTQVRWIMPGTLEDAAEWSGNEILHFGGMLIKAAENGDASWEAVSAMMETLDSEQDSRTGLWGIQRGCSQENAKRAAGAIARLYFYLNRPLKSPVDIAESVRLSLHAIESGTTCFSGMPHLISQTGEEFPPPADWLRRVNEVLTGSIPGRPRGMAPFNCWSFAA